MLLSILKEITSLTIVLSGKWLCQAYDSFRREVLYNILIESGIPRKQVGLIKMCLNETYSWSPYRQKSV